MTEKRQKMAIIVHSGTLDKLYPVFMLASTGGSMDMDVHLFFTFWGLDALKKGGLDKAKLPGIMSLGTGMMKGKIKSVSVPSLPELLEMCNMTENVTIYACSTTMAMMDVKKEELIPEVDEIVGAASFLAIAMDADVQLFI
ncbi:DsrE/DsrF/DrsH-like family protein [Candidatus Bathyarchaeota archaeon]|nr:DsrE/DsrF/DrsH-like family protein [Candidatus Bathyarchaeota archaeon]